MLFNSYAFLFGFLPISLVGFFALGRIGHLAAATWLVFASLVFYSWWNPAFCILLITSIAFNYGSSNLILKSEARPRLKAWLLGAAIAANLAALVYYKYLAWLVTLLNSTNLFALDVPYIILPLGISFFTFTQIGYLIDCAAGVAEDRNPLNYLLFVTFFPHLIAGPILHNQEIMPQFSDRSTYRFSSVNMAVGFGIFVVGLAKKCLLADPLSAGVGAAFDHPEELCTVEAWQAVLSYSLQLYFDFSGYSDMAIGLARMFNITFPLNFNSPYKSVCVIDYWQRWHMTLTRYLTQYVYTPIAMWIMRRRREGGQPINRDAQRSVAGFGVMIAFPIVVTMGLAGIWHGSGAQFLVFGLLHAFYLCANHAWRVFVREPGKARSGTTTRVGKILLTYVCVLVAAVFFRASSVSSALAMLAGMLGLHGFGGAIPVPAAIATEISNLFGARRVVRPVSWVDMATTAALVGRLACLYIMVWFLPNTQQIFVRYAPALGRVEPGAFRWLEWRMRVPWAIAIGCATALAILSVGGTSEFLYFQF